MDNQDMQENQVITVNESEQNPWLVGLEGHKGNERKSSARERQESSSSLISKLHPKNKKKRRKRESSTYSSSSRGVSLEVTLHPAKKKKCGRGEDEIILQLLAIHRHLMEMIQMITTYEV